MTCSHFPHRRILARKTPSTSPHPQGALPAFIHSSVHLSIPLFIHHSPRSSNLSIQYSYIHPSIFLSIHFYPPTIHQSVHSFISLLTYLFIHFSAHSFIHLFPIYPPTNQSSISTCISICLVIHPKFSSFLHSLFFISSFLRHGNHFPSLGL